MEFKSFYLKIFIKNRKIMSLNRLIIFLFCVTPKLFFVSDWALAIQTSYRAQFFSQKNADSSFYCKIQTWQFIRLQLFEPKSKTKQNKTYPQNLKKENVHLTDKSFQFYERNIQRKWVTICSDNFILLCMKSISHKYVKNKPWVVTEPFTSLPLLHDHYFQRDVVDVLIFMSTLLRRKVSRKIKSKRGYFSFQIFLQ